MGTHPIFESDFDCLTDPEIRPTKMQTRSTRSNKRKKIQTSRPGKVISRKKTSKKPKPIPKAQEETPGVRFDTTKAEKFINFFNTLPAWFVLTFLKDMPMVRPVRPVVKVSRN